MNRFFGRRAVQAAMAAILVLTAATSMGLSRADAAGGNNGSIRIDGGDIDNIKNNDPHVGCVFNVQWFGFDAGAQTANVAFDAQPPTGNVNLITDTFGFVGSGVGGNIDAAKAYDLSAALQANGLTAGNQGYHVKLTIDTTNAKGSISKSKTIFVQGCFPPSLNASTCQGPGGTSGITLAITNNDVTQTFSVVQDGVNRGHSASIPSGTTGTMSLAQPLNAVSSITVTSDVNPALSVTINVPAQICAGPVKGSVTLDKTLSGAGAPVPPDPSFAFTVTCQDPTATVTAAPSIKASDPVTTVASNVTLNTTCTITETGANGATSTSHTVNGGASVAGSSVTVTITNGTAVAVVFDNHYDPPVGSVTLDKTLSGGAAPIVADPAFAFTVSCTDPGATVTAAPSIKASDPATTVASNVALNTTCTITETGANGATSTSHTVNGGAPVAGASVTVTVTSAATPVAVVFDNNFASPLGSVTLDKTVSGGGAPGNDPSYDFTVACAGAGAVVTSPAHIKASDPVTTVATSVPLNTDCTIIETNSNGASSTTHAANGGAPAAGTSVTVTVTSAATPAAVVFDNHFNDPTGSVTLDKVVSGAAAPTNDPTFEFTVSCTGAGAVVTSPANIKASDPATTVATNVPLKTTCTITETNANGATGISYSVDGGAAQPGASVTVTITSATPVAVVATNQFDPGVGPVVVPTTVPPTTVPPTTEPPTTEPPTTVRPTTASPTTAPTAVLSETVTPPPASVLGVEITRALPRTGADSGRLLLMALALTLAGLVLVAGASYRQRAYLAAVTADDVVVVPAATTRTGVARVLDLFIGLAVAALVLVGWFRGAHSKRHRSN